MARVTLTASVLVSGGVVFSPVAAETDGNAVANTGNQFFYVNNGGGGAVVVTILTPLTVGGLAVAEATRTLAAGEEYVFGVFPTHIFSQSNGEVHIDYDGVASVTVQAFSL